MNKTINNRQICFIIFSYIVGYGIISLPKDITQTMGTSGWLSIIMGVLVILLSACLFIYLASRYKNQTIYEYSSLLIGKWFTYIITMIFVFYGLMTAGTVTRLTNETIRLTILINTPIWALSVVLFIVIYYALIQPLSVLGKVFEIFSILVIIFSIPIYFAILSQGQIINLRPLIRPFDYSELSKALPQVVFAFIGIEILAVIPLNTQKENKHILRHVTYIILFIGVYYIFIIESCISVMGIDSIQYYQEALFATIRRIEINDLQIFRRLDSIFLIAWILTIYSTIVLCLYIALAVLAKVFNNINRKILALILVILAYIISFLPSDFNAAQKGLELASYTGIIVLFVIPVILALVSFIKDRHTKQKKKASKKEPSTT